MSGQPSTLARAQPVLSGGTSSIVGGIVDPIEEEQPESVGVEATVGGEKVMFKFCGNMETHAQHVEPEYTCTGLKWI